MKKHIIISIFIIFGFIVSSSVYGAFTEDDAGTVTADFLKLDIGGRAAGLGNSYAGLSDDSTAIYWNPAGLNQLSLKKLDLMHAIWFEDIFYDWVSYSMPFKYGNIGIGFQYLSYGKIYKTDETGLEDGSFTPYEYCIITSYAKKMFNIPMGINLKYISSNIEDETAYSFATDIGGMYKLFNDKLSLGLAVQNIGTKMKYMEEEEELPFNIKYGACYEIRSNWIAVFDINMPVDNKINIGMGSEYSYKINDLLSLAGRIGYNNRAIKTGGTNGITGGFGIKYRKYDIDYAFMPFGDLGNTHRISFGYKF